MAEVQEFRKYEQRGAYHWVTMRPSLRISFDPYLHARYTTALGLVPPAAPGTRAVDLGCGDGYFTSLLAAKGYRAIGIDGMQTAVELARKAVSATPHAANAEFAVGNICATPLPAGTFDVIACLDVIEHLDDPHSLLREIQRIGKKGATVVLGTPIRLTHKPYDKYHVQEFFVDEFRDLLAAYFDVREIRCTHPVEWLALMGRKTRLFGKQRHLAWNFINLYVVLTGRNPFAATDARFPTYQFAVGTLR
jgi:2-polyprenyl-3-methyl-5-hydroxy-6-metoxy-1,4-benzoquinol methylase